MSDQAKRNRDWYAECLEDKRRIIKAGESLAHIVRKIMGHNWELKKWDEAIKGEKTRMGCSFVTK